MPGAVYGICKAIEPPVRPNLWWAATNDQIVLGIDARPRRMP
jgi:hypothetical protein